MNYILEGISLGIVLAVSLGPIFVTLTQASLEEGSIAGFAVGFGVWTSDIIILASCLYMIREISDVVNGAEFQFWLGMSGSIILFAYGVLMVLTNPKPLKTKEMLSIKSFSNFFLKGFLINTVNPFTFVFWLGVMSTYIIGRNTDTEGITYLLVTIMTIIILSDSFKVLLAKLIREKLKPHHFNWISKTAGIGLMIFAIVLMMRVL